MVIHEFSGCSGHVARVLLCNEYVHLRVVSALQTWIDAVERLDEVVEEMIKLMQRRQLCRERRRVRWDLEAPQMLTTGEMQGMASLRRRRNRVRWEWEELDYRRT
jgi:hypothetical protein